MKPKPSLLAILTLLSTSLVLSSMVRAQNTAPTNSNATQNASAQQDAQSSSAAVSANPSGGAATAVPSEGAAKKVWTNEDMGSVHRNDAISTFSTTNTKAAKAKPTANSQAPRNGGPTGSKS